MQQSKENVVSNGIGRRNRISQPVLVTPTSNLFYAPLLDKDSITTTSSHSTATTLPDNPPSTIEDFDALSISSTMSDTPSFLTNLTNRAKYEYPDLSDVHRERILVGNNLTNHTQHGSATGLAYIIDSKATQHACLDLSHWDMYTCYKTPKQPGILTNAEQAYAFKIKNKIYKRHVACELEVVKYLSQKFPSLNSKKTPLGTFPKSYTSMHVINNLIVYFSNENRCRETANKYREEMAALRYQPNAAGLQTFFKDMDKLAQRLDNLGMFQTSVTDKMTYSQSAFQWSNVAPNIMREINTLCL